MRMRKERDTVFYRHKSRLTRINKEYKERFHEKFKEPEVRDLIKGVISDHIMVPGDDVEMRSRKWLAGYFKIANVHCPAVVEQMADMYKTMDQHAHGRIHQMIDLWGIGSEWDRKRRQEGSGAYPNRLIHMFLWKECIAPIFREWMEENPQQTQEVAFEIDYKYSF